VPEQALVPRGRDNFVFRIVDGKAAMTRVELGLRRAGDVEVLSGLAAGDAIVVDGQLKLQDGTAVKLFEESPPAGGVEGKSKN
jgi:membrane fusion protein, multidrug efflux system